jgi:hypothetical protein
MLAAIGGAMSEVTIHDPERMNLLGLILGSLIERNVAGDPELKRRFDRLEGAVAVTAGRMAITLRFGRGSLTVERGAAAGTRASVRGSLDTLMGLSLGKGMVGPFLSGKLKARGTLFLLKLMPLLRAK